jgi:hypothetical protein
MGWSSADDGTWGEEKGAMLDARSAKLRDPRSAMREAARCAIR